MLQWEPKSLLGTFQFVLGRRKSSIYWQRMLTVFMAVYKQEVPTQFFFFFVFCFLGIFSVKYLRAEKITSVTKTVATLLRC